MRINRGGRVYLEEGEAVPVRCRCGAVYQPQPDEECSDCLVCRRVNHHEHMPPWRSVHINRRGPAASSGIGHTAPNGVHPATAILVTLAALAAAIAAFRRSE